MDELAVRIEVLFRGFLTACDQHQGSHEGLAVLFRREMDQLFAEYGKLAVNAVLDDLAKKPWPSISLH
jgi:hypothetical protein